MKVKLVNVLTYVPILSYKKASLSHNSNRHTVQYKRPVATWPPMGVVNAPGGGVPLGRSREILHGPPQVPNVQNCVKILPKSLTV